MDLNRKHQSLFGLTTRSIEKHGYIEYLHCEGDK